MGRRGRQQQRAQRRRQEPRPSRPTVQTPPVGKRPSSAGRIVPAALILVALAVAGLVVTVRAGLGGQATGPAPTATPVLGRPIDGMQCSAEMLTYHVHAHLTILDRGRQVVVPANTGIVDNYCLYWLHTHDPSGIIHVEAPKPFTPTLGNFFDVWGQPLSRRRAATAIVERGQSMRVYVNLKRYNGNPRTIPLRAHTTITIEVGPPFSAPQPFYFDGL